MNTPTLQDQSTIIFPFTPIPIYHLQIFVTFKLDLAGESTLEFILDRALFHKVATLCLLFSYIQTATQM